LKLPKGSVLLRAAVLALVLIMATPALAHADEPEGTWELVDDGTPTEEPQPPNLFDDVNPWMFADQGGLVPFVDVAALAGLPFDPLGFLPLGAVLDGDITNMLPDTRALDGTVSGLLGALPDVRAILTNVRDYADELDLDSIVSELHDFAPPLPFLKVLTDQQLPTSYTLTLSRSGYAPRVYTSVQVCVPFAATWPGTTPPIGAAGNELVHFCPSPSPTPAATLTGRWTPTTGNPPTGASMSVAFAIPAVPGVLDSTVLRASAVGEGSRAFPATVKVEAQVQPGAGAYSSGKQITLGFNSIDNSVPAAVVVPLASAAISLDGYGSGKISAFPGGEGAFTLQYSPEGSFQANWQQSATPGASQQLELHASKGPNRVADATFTSLKSQFSYTLTVIRQQFSSSPDPKPVGVKAQGSAITSGMSANFVAFNDNDQPAARVVQNNWPINFSKELKVAYDPTGNYPTAITSTQYNTPNTGATLPPFGDVIEVGLLNTDWTPSRTLQALGMGVSASAGINIRYDDAWKPAGFTATLSNDTDTNQAFFQAAQWGSNSKVFTLSQAGASQVPHGPWTAGVGSHTDVTAANLFPSFNLDVDLVQPSGTDSTSGLHIQSMTQRGIDLAAPNSTIKLATRDAQTNPLGFLVKAFPKNLDLKVNVVSAQGAPTGVSVEESDSIRLANMVRQVWRGVPGAPNQTLLSVEGPSGDPAEAGGYVAATKLSLRRISPPEHYSFEVTAPAGLCNAPSSVRITTDNFNVASTSSTAGSLELKQNAIGGGVIDTNLSPGHSVRTVTFTFDSSLCLPLGIKLEGATGNVDQPLESLRLWTSYGQIMLANLSRSFTTDLTFQLTGSGGQATLHQTNAVANPSQFIQFGKSANPNFVFTVENIVGNGPVPPGAMGLTAGKWVRAHAMDPSDFVLTIGASSSGGTSATLSGTNTEVRPTSSIKLGSDSNTVDITGLDRHYDLDIKVSSGLAASVSGKNLDGYTGTAVTLTSVTSQQVSSLQILGPTATNPPAQPSNANLKGVWANAPPKGFSLSLGYDAGTKTLNVSLGSAQYMPSSTFQADFKLATIEACSTGCHLAMGGSLLENKTFATGIAINEAAGNAHIETSTTGMQYQYVQVWVTNANGTKKTLMNMLGTFSLPPITDYSVTESLLTATNVADSFSFDIGSKKGADGKVTFNLKQKRDFICGQCEINIDNKKADAAVSKIRMSGIPKDLTLAGNVDGAGLTFTYGADVHGLNLTVGQREMTIILTGMPTSLKGTTSGAFKTLDYRFEVDASDSTCGTDLPSCELQSGRIIKTKQELDFPKKVYEFDNVKVGPNECCTLAGNVTINMSYRYALDLELAKITRAAVTFGADTTTKIPFLKLTKESYQTPNVMLYFLGPNGTGAPQVCTPTVDNISPDCSTLAPNFVSWRVDLTVPGGTFTRQSAPGDNTASSTRPGKLFFWGWETKENVADTKYQLGTSSDTKINSLISDLFTDSVPFTPPYSVQLNAMGGPGLRDRVYVLNFENWAFMTSSQQCPRFFVRNVWTTNCIWQAALSKIPAKPPSV
jgi:hypothetical protein